MKNRGRGERDRQTKLQTDIENHRFNQPTGPENCEIIHKHPLYRLPLSTPLTLSPDNNKSATITPNITVSLKLYDYLLS